MLASRSSPAARRTALQELLSTYWKPLYVYARHCGSTHDDAQDAVQGLCTRLLESEFLDHLDPERGRLRAYLRTAMRNHLASAHARDHAVKRGGGAPLLAIDDEVDESMLGNGCATPEAAFDRAWALTVMQRALTRLESEHRTGRQRTPFEVIASYFDPTSEPPSYDDAAARLGISSGLLRVAVHRARLRFKALLAEEAADTVSDAEAGEEIGELLRSLQS